ncbi:unnamed protein product [Schistosoma mattheei]|uniref:Uncharacterized protein n=1 Tax=Schistosoma mattheei TaxID=31246 RepID=A0A183P730_9TREM|nr:unnamed protein product [Schistosoma mattheei]
MALLSHTQKQMQEKTTTVAAASAVGLNIHEEKSKILRYDTACNNRITLHGEALKDVNPLHIWAASLMNTVDLMQL